MIMVVKIGIWIYSDIFTRCNTNNGCDTLNLLYNGYQRRLPRDKEVEA
jgi:hypothetical protein